MAIINEEQIAKVADLFKNLPETGKGLNFYSYMKDGQEVVDKEKYPPFEHPQTINFLFFTVMQDFGFWYGDEHGYLEPLYGGFYNDYKRVKGSDLLWKMCLQAMMMDEMQFEPRRLAEIKPFELAEIFSDKRGPVPWPDFETRFKMTRAYGNWFVNEGARPANILLLANQEEESLKEFLCWMKKIPGYDKDNFQKRNLLLAMALANRPEEFLTVMDSYNWKPIVDYHLMRIALRLGLVDLDGGEEFVNKGRRWVSQKEEAEIRYNTFAAVSLLIKKCGRPMSFVDEKMWMGRKYCPEMTAPECDKCIFTNVCKKRVELFQPVYRTTAY